MKIEYYTVSGETCDQEGRYYTSKLLARFIKREDAEKFKKDWENLWQTHEDNNECISPCWFDFKKKLEINLEKIEICENYHGLISDINYKYNYKLYK